MPCVSPQQVPSGPQTQMPAKTPQDAQGNPIPPTGRGHRASFKGAMGVRVVFPPLHRAQEIRLHQSHPQPAQQMNATSEIQDGEPTIHPDVHQKGQLHDLTGPPAGVPALTHNARPPPLPQILLPEPAPSIQGTPFRLIFSTKSLHEDPYCADCAPAHKGRDCLSIPGRCPSEICHTRRGCPTSALHLPYICTRPSNASGTTGSLSTWRRVT